ncbi:MAG: hypothetical protein KBD73_01970 [Candidatus Magasanikbacteria bacterium]|nr:hypothetical protein [Candidatus Magasanikbacteria bacterium]
MTEGQRERLSAKEMRELARQKKAEFSSEKAMRAHELLLARISSEGSGDLLVTDNIEVSSLVSQDSGEKCILIESFVDTYRSVKTASYTISPKGDWRQNRIEEMDESSPDSPSLPKLIESLGI